MLFLQLKPADVACENATLSVKEGAIVEDAAEVA